jgi:hypothetical protein
MPDFRGEGELPSMAACGLAVSGVKLTCLTSLTLLARRGVVGAEGKGILRSALLALLLKVGMDDGAGGAAGGFLELLGYRRMDLTFCRVPGLRRKFLETDFGVFLRLGVVDDFVKVRGVLFREGLDGDRDNVGI